MTAAHDPAVTRRLAAILIADVVGYTRLMERDDSGTFSRLRNIRDEVVDPAIVSHGGRIVKTAGDGLVAEFTSAVAALRAAIQIQREMAVRNGATTAEERIDYRIGVNLGDIMVDASDIAGDGVNVASRLETLAEPGGICVSGSVREQVHGNLDVEFDDIGEQQVKNIARPIRVYRVLLERDAPQTSASAASRPRILHWRRWTAGLAALVVVGLGAWLLPQLWRPAAAPGPPAMSLAILSFAAPSDDRLGETVSRDLAAGIGKSVRSAKVVLDGRVSGSVDARAVGRELNVRYLVMGDIRPAGDRTIVNVQLVETAGATQIWSDRLELPQQRTADDEKALVSSLTLRLTDVIKQAERRRANATAGSPDAGAMDFVLRADVLRINSSADLDRNLAARKLYDEALRMDPGLAAALIGRAWTIEQELWNNPRADYESLARELDRDSARAVQLDPRDAFAWNMRDGALTWLGRHDAAKQANATARQLDSTSKSFHAEAAFLTVLDGEPDKGIAFLDQARAIDQSVDALTSRVACIVEVYRANYTIAAPFCEKAALLSGWWMEYLHMTAAYAQAGDLQKAAASKAELLRLRPDFSISRYQEMVTRFSDNPVYQRLTQERVLAGLRKAGIPEK